MGHRDRNELIRSIFAYNTRNASLNALISPGSDAIHDDNSGCNEIYLLWIPRAVEFHPMEIHEPNADG